jgi:hypothetical protein
MRTKSKERRTSSLDGGDDPNQPLGKRHGLLLLTSVSVEELQNRQGKKSRGLSRENVVDDDAEQVLGLSVEHTKTATQAAKSTSSSTIPASTS